MNAGTLKLVRSTMLSGMLVIFCVMGYLVEYEGFNSGIEQPSPVIMNGLFLFVTLIALTVIVILRNKSEALHSFQNKSGLVLAGWAAGDGVAIFGAVVYLLTSSRLLLLAGFLVLAMAFFLLPVPDEADTI